MTCTVTSSGTIDAVVTWSGIGAWGFSVTNGTYTNIQSFAHPLRHGSASITDLSYIPKSADLLGHTGVSILPHVCTGP
jgi:hypothetical protein